MLSLKSLVTDEGLQTKVKLKAELFCCHLFLIPYRCYKLDRFRLQTASRSVHVVSALQKIITCLFGA